MRYLACGRWTLRGVLAAAVAFILGLVPCLSLEPVAEPKQAAPSTTLAKPVPAQPAKVAQPGVISALFKALTGADTAQQPAANVEQEKALEAYRKQQELEAQELKKASERGSHVQTSTLAVASPGMVFKALCTDKQGRVLTALATNTPVGGKGEVKVFDANGSPAGGWKVEFPVQAINVGPDGAIYAAGDGRIARFDSTGKLLAEGKTPQLSAMAGDSVEIERQVKARQELELTTLEQQVKSWSDNLEKLKAKDAESLTPGEKALLKRNEQMMAQLDARLKVIKGRSLEAMIAEATSKQKTCIAVTISDKDIFVVSPAAQGYGYCVARCDLEFQNPKSVIAELRGCCGQAHVEAAGDALFVADNTKHQISKYDRDGKLLAGIGKRATADNSLAEGFGSCCNPMNCCYAADGHLYASESDGKVKKFTLEGKFVDFVGVAGVNPGCKNSQIAVAPKGDRVYYYDGQKSQVIVLARRAAASPATTPTGAQ